MLITDWLSLFIFSIDVHNIKSFKLLFISNMLYNYYEENVCFSKVMT